MGAGRAWRGAGNGEGKGTFTGTFALFDIPGGFFWRGYDIFPAGIATGGTGGDGGRFP